MRATVEAHHICFLNTTPQLEKRKTSPKQPIWRKVYSVTATGRKKHPMASVWNKNHAKISRAYFRRSLVEEPVIQETLHTKNATSVVARVLLEANYFKRISETEKIYKFPGCRTRRAQSDLDSPFHETRNFADFAFFFGQRFSRNSQQPRWRNYVLVRPSPPERRSARR